jgi:hypothetical protein
VFPPGEPTSSRRSREFMVRVVQSAFSREVRARFKVTMIDYGDGT